MADTREAYLTTKRHTVWHLILILYIGFIFSNSLTPASISSRESGFVLQTVHRFLAATGLSAPWLTEHIIRKCAHFTEYTVMGILLRGSTSRLPLGRAGRRLAHIWLLSFIPFVDETLQLFTEGRSGQLSDVWLDMSGVLFGTILSCLVSQLFCWMRAGREIRKPY